ncbi:MAG: type II toxin-antitoxin system prevent-host-death family antitoxin [Opitutaceae bacterium]|nr:type II toxin-antitoxin system prevent-host-death family antitoxin [Opitutaceae bacterium]
MKVINIQAAKTHLSRLVEEAAAGEEIILAKAGKPLVRIIPYTPAKATRKGGQLRGKIWESEDAWAPDSTLAAAMTLPSIYPFPGDDTGSSLVAEDPSSKP